MAAPGLPRTTVPFTYLLDYGGYAGHLDEVESFVRRIAEAPPHLLHVAHDTPLPTTAGPVLILPDYATRRLAAAEVRERTARIAEMVERVHAAGVSTFIPYICNQTIAGDPHLRRGIWEFYDHWTEYAELNLAPRPETDPIEWLARERNGRPHFNYEMRHEQFVRRGMFRFAPCVNNPHYRAYLRMIVTEIARVGYDGVFVDNCILNCYCPFCQDRFRRYLAARYPAPEPERRFGIADPQRAALAYRGSRLEWVKDEPTFKEFLADTFSEDELIRWLGTANLNEARLEEGGNGWLWGRAHDYRKWMEQRYAPRELERRFRVRDLSQWGLRTPEERALWAETKLFWAESIRDNLAFIKQIGCEVRGAFYVLPNWGAMQSFDATEFREEIAHDIESWAPAMDAVMYEEDGDAGRVAHGFYLDHLVQHKLALALGVPGCVMASRGQREGIDELGHAQALAAGGGAYIQLTHRFPRMRARYRAFIDDNAGLLGGLRSYADIALGCFTRELRMENHAHLRQVYQISRYLADHHALFDLIAEKHLTREALREYRVLILPEARYLSDSEVIAIREFVERGGLLCVTGESGSCDETAKPRSANPLTDLLQGRRRGATGVVVSGDGHCLHARQAAALIGADSISREDALDFAMYSAASLNVPAGRSAAAVYELDRMIGVDRYYERGRLIPWLERVLGHRIRLAEGRRTAGVRFNAYYKPGLIVLHAVNYNVGVAGPRAGAVEPVRGLPVTLPLRQGFQAKAVILREVGGQDLPARHQISGGLVRFRIPHLRIHQMAFICETNASQGVSAEGSRDQT